MFIGLTENAQTIHKTFKWQNWLLVSPCMAIQFIKLQMLGYTKLHHFYLRLFKLTLVPPSTRRPSKSRRCCIGNTAPRSQSWSFFFFVFFLVIFFLVQTFNSIKAFACSNQNNTRLVIITRVRLCFGHSLGVVFFTLHSANPQSIHKQFITCTYGMLHPVLLMFKETRISCYNCFTERIMNTFSHRTWCAINSFKVRIDSSHFLTHTLTFS